MDGENLYDSIMEGAFELWLEKDYLE